MLLVSLVNGLAVVGDRQGILPWMWHKRPLQILRQTLLQVNLVGIASVNRCCFLYLVLVCPEARRVSVSQTERKTEALKSAIMFLTELERSLVVQQLVDP